MLRKRRPKKKINIQRLTHDDVPASVGLVNEVRGELSAEIELVLYDLLARFVQSDEKIEKLDHKIDTVSRDLIHRMDNLEHKMGAMEHKMDSKFQQVLTITHRTQILMEQQRGENKIVLEAQLGVLVNPGSHEYSDRTCRFASQKIRSSFTFIHRRRASLKILE